MRNSAPPPSLPGGGLPTRTPAPRPRSNPAVAAAGDAAAFRASLRPEQLLMESGENPGALSSDSAQGALPLYEDNFSSSRPAAFGGADRPLSQEQLDEIARQNQMARAFDGNDANLIAHLARLPPLETTAQRARRYNGPLPGTRLPT